MAQATLRIRVYSDGKKKYEVSSDPFYSQENIAELKRRIDEIESGKSTLEEHELIEVD